MSASPSALRSAMTGPVLVALAFTLARLPLAALLELSPDEAYYWMWSRRLGASYFDHPPMVAWLIAGATRIFGDAEWAVRLPALASGFVIPVALAHAAHTLAPEGRKAQAALATALLASVMPLLNAGSVIVTPDSPAAAFWAIALAAVCVARAPGNAWAWYAAGAAMGLALLSKYTTVLLGVSLAALAPFDPALRRALRTPHPWMAAALAWALFMPVVVWNAQHEWASFAFQLDHGTGGRNGGLGTFLEYLGAQAAILTPMLALVFALHLFRGGSAADRSGDLLLSAAVLPSFLLFALLSLRSRPEANWPAFAYLGIAVVGGLSAVSPSITRRRLVAATVLCGGAATLLVSIHALHPLVNIPRDRLRKEFRGWRVRGELARNAAKPGDVILGDSYRTASEAAYYGEFAPERVGVARREGERRSMFDLWGRPAIPPEANVIYVSARVREIPPEWSEGFSEAKRISLPLGVSGTVARLERVPSPGP